MRIIDQDITLVNDGIIVHQVNCQGKMNSGIAKQLREKWPVVFTEYTKMFSQLQHNWELLGKVQFVEVQPGLSIANVFGQLNFAQYGKSDGARYTDYSALVTAFKNISGCGLWEPIYIPYNFGCDRGGADWKIVSEIIEHYTPNAFICKFTPKIK